MHNIPLEQSNAAPANYPTAGIADPGMNDVLCGRGGGTNNHVGNIRFRQLVNGHKLRYLAATKSEKPMVAREVVAIWRNLIPPGRFLAQEKQSNNVGANGKKDVHWNDVGDKKAREKASQCLRERTPDVIPFVKKLELQLTLEEQEKAFNLASGILTKPETLLPVISDGTTESDVDQGLTASDITRHLLHQQKQAAIAAHAALNAYIPNDLMNTYGTTNKVMSSNVSVSSALPSLIGSTTSTSLTPLTTSSADMSMHSSPLIDQTPVPVTTLSMQREKISQEIADLEMQRAKLQAVIEEKKIFVGTSTINHIDNSAAPKKRLILPDSIPSNSSSQIFPKRRGRREMGGAVPSAADLLSGFSPDAPHMVEEKPFDNAGDTTLTREEYQNSVQQLMGDHEKLLAKSGSNTSNNREETLDPSDFLDTMSINSWVCPPDRLEGMESMSRLSWMKSMQSMQSVDNVSMASGNPNMCNGEPSFHESWGTLPANNLSSKNSKRDIMSVRSDSMSTLNTYYLDTMIPSQSNAKTSMMPPQNRSNAPGNAYGVNKAQELASPPILMNHNEPVYDHNQIGGPSLRPSMFTAGQPTTGVSQMSMLSDLSDLSFYKKGESMRSLAMKAQKALQSDTTMSDMSEAMATLELMKRNI